jgi:hypothetical protein
METLSDRRAEVTFEPQDAWRVSGARHVSVRWLWLAASLAAIGGGLIAGGITAYVAHSSHFTLVSPGSLNVQASRAFNVNAGHVRLVGRDGVFEFEHQGSVPLSKFEAFFLGTSKRTPIQIGEDDGANIVALLVVGSRGQKTDLQEWALGPKVVAAIDRRGGLRLGDVTVTTTVKAGVPYLVARTQAGRVFTLPLGHSASHAPSGA